MLGKNVVALRAFDQDPEARIGKPRAGVLGDRAHHLLVAAVHQHISDHLIEDPASGNGKEVLLAFGSWQSR